MHGDEARKAICYCFDGVQFSVSAICLLSFIRNAAQFSKNAYRSLICGLHLLRKFSKLYFKNLMTNK